MNTEAPKAEKAAPHTVARDAFTVTEVEMKLGISRASIYRRIADGSLRSNRIGSARRIPASEIARLLGDAHAAQPLAA